MGSSVHLEDSVHLDAILKEPTNEPVIDRESLAGSGPIINDLCSHHSADNEDAGSTLERTTSIGTVLGSLVVSQFMVAPSRSRWNRRLTRRRGTMSFNLFHKFVDDASRAGRMLSTEDAAPECNWVKSVLRGSMNPSFKTASTSALHRTMVMEWEEGSRVLRSLAVRAQDLTDEDVVMSNEYFSVIDALMSMYRDWKRSLIGIMYKNEDMLPLLSAMQALTQFSQAREQLSHCRCVSCAHEMVSRGMTAREAVLRFTFGEATEAEKTGDADFIGMAQSWGAGCITSRLLVAILGRGVVPKRRDHAEWCKKMLVKEKGVGSVKRVFRKMREHLWTAKLFEIAETEYRSKFS